MSNKSSDQWPSIIDNPAVVGLTGTLLFVLGLVVSSSLDQSGNMTLVLILSIGVPFILYSLALIKIEALQKRIRELENKSNP
jgi:hypothetical protein